MTTVYEPARRRLPGWTKVVGLCLVLVCLLPVYFGVRSVWGLLTLRYELTPDNLVITFGPEQTVIRRTEVSRVATLRPTGGKRVRGTGMSNLQAGLWSFAETGRITLYSTTTNPLTVIETGAGKWGISPADPAGFERALAQGGTGVFEPAGGGGASGLVGPVLLALIAPAVGGGLAVYLVRAWKGLRYLLTDQELVIETGWSRVGVPYTRMTGAESAAPGGFPLRLFGTGMPGLHLGSFAWKQAGPNLKLYTTRIKPLILISAGKQTYGVTPEDGEGFLADLRRRIAKG